MEYRKPLPQISETNRPFWEAAARHELRAPRCKNCGNVWLPPAPVCSNCLSSDLEWVRLSGRGKVWSWVVFHYPYFETFKEDIPYNVAFVELDEGPFITTNLVDIDNGDIQIGLPVEVAFEDVAPGISLPKFRPLRST